MTLMTSSDVVRTPSGLAEQAALESTRKGAESMPLSHTGDFSMLFPRMFRVRQSFPGTSIEQPDEELRGLLQQKGACMARGKKVAIAVGSRGIANIATLIATLAEELKKAGVEPFIVPAMGSHGGATAEGQLAILASLGIVEERVGAPILASMEVLEIGRTPEGVPVYCDEKAYGADAIVVVNRIKPHTAFKADIESGLMKMMAVGLGKREGAETAHARGLAKAIPPMARVVLERVPVAFAIALIENAFHRTAKIMVLDPRQVEAEEKQLLRQAKRLMPHLPFDELDVLIVEEMGKNISGSGMDTNVIGIGRRIGGRWKPQVARLVVLDLTDESHGNAFGLGLADFTTRQLVAKIDSEATRANVEAAGYSPAGRIPLTLESDREAIAMALHGYRSEGVRLLRIINTLDLGEFDVSEGLLDQVKRVPDLVLLGERGRLAFDSLGNLL